MDATDWRTVLIYWFGDGIDSNMDHGKHIHYKTRWFPEGNSEIQSITDKEITNKFESVLKSALEAELEHWEIGLTDLLSNDQLSVRIKSHLALIIVLDQFSRHIYRYYKLSDQASERLNAEQLALAVAQRLHGCTSSFVSMELENLPMAHFVFSLMPFRHSLTIHNYQYVLNKLSAKESRESNNLELLNRFRKQTIRRLQHMQDRAKLEETDDILERPYSKTDESDIINHKLVKTTEQFLLNHMVTPQRVDQNGPYDLFISLSGGVDSMVLSKILVVIRDAYRSRSPSDSVLLVSHLASQSQSSSVTSSKEKRANYPGKRQSILPIRSIVAMHVDYANRPESGREADYVKQWCQLIGIDDCRVRVINEVTRGITNRDEYEKISREIRYGFYLECLQEYQSRKGEEGEEGEVGVIFGHHQGDVEENVISNVMRGCNPLYLSGMTESSLTNGVRIWRPLLSHPKADIYEFAHRYGVPYFKDSTPSWSTRGKLRQALIPLLVDMYGEGCLMNLSSLARVSDDTRALVNENIYLPILSAVKRFPCGLMVNLLDYRYQPTCFWKEILKLLMHSMNMGMVRESAVESFIERIRKSKPSKQGHHQSSASTPSRIDGQDIIPGWLELRKGYHSYLTRHGDLVLLRDGVLKQHLVVLNQATTVNQQRQKILRKQQLDQENLNEIVAAKDVKMEGTAWSRKDLDRILFEIQLKFNHIEKAGKTEEEDDDASNVEMEVSYDSEAFIQLSNDFSSDKKGAAVPHSMEMQSIASSHHKMMANGEELVILSVTIGVWKLDLFAQYFVDGIPNNHATSMHQAQTAKMSYLLSTINQLLPGEFEYFVYLNGLNFDTRDELRLGILYQQHEQLDHWTKEGMRADCQLLIRLDEKESSPDERSFHVWDLQHTEYRIRQGLPLLLPLLQNQNQSEPFYGDRDIGKKILIRCKYQYVGSTLHALQIF